MLDTPLINPGQKETLVRNRGMCKEKFSVSLALASCISCIQRGEE